MRRCIKENSDHFFVKFHNHYNVIIIYSYNGIWVNGKVRNIALLCACVAAVKCRPVHHNCVVISFSGHKGSWIECCLQLKMEFR